MPFTKAPSSLRARGIEYQILFSFRRDSSKWIFKAFRKDRLAGIGQNVLIKVFLKDLSAYKYEFESLSRVSSPFCARLLGFESFFGGKKALILEYINGVSLQRLMENFSLSQQEIRHILTGIYKGLEDLKKQKLCHGDLSPDNVLIDDKSRIKLIDFGKANCSPPHGTPPFLAPEVLKGVTPHFASDLYSLGAIEVLLENPCPISSLKDFKIDPFNKNNPLLDLDPAQRAFPYETAWRLQDQRLNSLAYKVKDLMSALGQKRLNTLKYNRPKRKFKAFSLAHFAKALPLLCALSFVAPSGSSSPGSCCGLIKIYTHRWHIIEVGGAEAYSPVIIPLKQGSYMLKWKSKDQEGSLQVFVSKGESLSLNEKSLRGQAPAEKGAVPQ